MRSTSPLLALSLFLASLASAIPAGAEEPVRLGFFIEPVFQKGFGGTAYDLSFDAGGGWTGLSRLEFPELSLEAGAVLGASINRGAKREWLIEAGVTHSTLAMAGTMNDWDWYQPGSSPKIPFSYTYSDDSTVSWHAFFEAAWTVAYDSPWTLALYGSYRYQNTSHVEDTVTGWNYDWSNSYAMTYDSHPWLDVLEYSLISHSLGIGLLGEVSVTPAFSLQLRACYTPVYVSDRDDHKLRTKLSTADGWGNGVYANFRAAYKLNAIGRVTPYLALDGTLIYYVVDTVQTQYWYGNLDTVPQGTTMTDIGHLITGTQYGFSLRAGFSF